MKHQIGDTKEDITGITAKEYWKNQPSKLKRHYSVSISNTPYFNYDKVFNKKNNDEENN